MARYQFGRCELDTDRHRLKVAGIERQIEPRVFDLIRVLLENGEQLVTRDDLIRAVWKGRVVSDSAISVRVNAARKLVGDDGTLQSIIKTVPKMGFKLAIPVSRINLSAGVDSATRASGPAARNPQVPVVGIFPFDCLGDEIPDYLARGIVDDIAIDLSRFHNIHVLSTYSTFRHDFSQTNILDVARQLGITHAVTGSLQGAESNWRINVHLSDATDGNQIWSERYDVHGDELFETQGQAAYRIVSALFNGLTEHQTSVARRKPTSNLNAYECLLRGLQIYKWGISTLEEGRQAMFWFDRAIELDADFGRARAWRECCQSSFWSSPPASAEIDESARQMRLAYSLDENDHEVHRLKGALHMLNHEFELAEYHLAKSVELNPNDAHILLKIGFYRHFLADNADDLSLVDLAFERNPLHPSWYWHDRGATLFAHQRYEEAIGNLRRFESESESTYLYLAACQMALGQESEARTSILSLKKLNPRANIDWLNAAYPTRCYQPSERATRFHGLLRAAGL